jgi:tRNA(fMet)-specific endonuclease VapC
MDYLLDTSICVFFFRGNVKVMEQLRRAGTRHLYISEMTLGELLYGAECSARPEENRRMVAALCREVTVLPLTDVWQEFALQKAQLRRKGLMIEDADILIGSTALKHSLVMVTDNGKHIGRLEGITVENWAK